ncbi:inhibitor-3 [Wolffia australiana]
MARSAARIAASSATATVTLVVEDGGASSSAARPETVLLRLSRPKKKVTWKEGTVDNEFLGRKSSKKCCIFHKEKPFDECSSDDEDDGDRAGCGSDGGDVAGKGHGCCPHGGVHRRS